MAFARVQGIGVHTTGTNTIILTLPATVGAGNFVAGLFSWDSSTVVTFNSCSDDKGNTYNISAAVNDSVDGQQSAIFWLGNITNAPKIITGTFSTTPAAASGTATEWSGVFAASDPKDVAAAGSFNNPSTAGTDGITSPSITTLTDGCMIVGFDNNATGAGGNATAGTGFTITDQDTVAGVNTDIEFRTQTTAGAVQATFTLASGIKHTVWVLAVQPAVAAVSLIAPLLFPARSRFPIAKGPFAVRPAVIPGSIASVSTIALLGASLAKAFASLGFAGTTALSGAANAQAKAKSNGLFTAALAARTLGAAKLIGSLGHCRQTVKMRCARSRN
jgi:hypothetical protein